MQIQAMNHSDASAGDLPTQQMGLFAFGLTLLMFLLSCNAPMNPSDFPPTFQAPNPIGGDELGEPSLYIHDPATLRDADVAVPPQYAQFLTHADTQLAQLARNAHNREFAAWLEAQRSATILLEVHTNAKFGLGRDLVSDHYIQFSAIKDYQDWKRSYPSYGVSVELLQEPLDHLPKPLQEVYGLGVLWLYGPPQSGFFYRPHAIKPALQEEYLSEFISDSLYFPLNYPMEELMVFYTDSGCWLMYDKAEHVYCGGVECGDFYRSSQDLEQVIGNIFHALRMGKGELSIEAFAPR